MFCDTSRRRSPSTWTFWSIHDRNRATSSSVRSRTRVSGEILLASHTVRAVLRPRPKMYVSDTSSRFSRGMSTPAILAISLYLTLSLLVARVWADDPDRAVAADHLALLAHLLDRRTDLHADAYLYR